MQDARLREGFRLHYVEGWPAVAQFVGEEITAVQCARRWSEKLQHVPQGLDVDREWSDEAVSDCV